METTLDVGPKRPRHLWWLAMVLLALIAGGIWTWRRMAGHEEHGGERAPGQSAADAPAPAMTATRSPADAAIRGTQRIRIAPERQQQIGVKFAQAREAPAAVETRAVGRVAYDERRITHVHTKVSGWIENVFVDFVGAPVKRGQPLFTIYSPDLVSSQEDYLLALRAKGELGGSSFPRLSEGSRALADSARRRLELWDMTAAQIQALEAQGKVSRTVTVASPVSGVVVERAAYHHGKTVTPEIDLYTIVDLSRVWVLTSVYEYEAPFVRVGQAAEISLPYEADPRGLHGRVTFIAPFLDPKTRTVEVRMEFPNPNLALRPESFVNVVLRRDLGKRLIVPKDAVLDTGVSQYVFVDKGDGYLEPREITAGPEVGAGRVITRGLDEGERVVTAANFILDSESRLKGAIDAMGRPVPAQASAGSASKVTADVTTEPSPAKVGRNRIRALIKDASGEPIGDVEVDIRLFMPQMAGMAQVDVRAALPPAGRGVYVGEVEIPIAWSFATTLTVRRGGAVLGIVETTITSR